MVELTVERRAELVALLGDEVGLRARFPKAADYLGVALPGTGDEGADAAFDLRFVHFMTGGVSANPYWDIVASSVSEREGRRVVDGGRAAGSARLGYAQTILQASYAYAVPSPETVAWAAEFCAGRSVLELGAGRGYWAAQLHRAGVAVRAYDSEPPGRVANVSFPDAAGQRDVWHEVHGVDAFEERLREGSADAVLFLCWPPGWGGTMASDALTRFESAGGRRVLYIGEARGGKTGDDAFFDALDARWRLETEDSRFVSWWNLSDRAQGWART
ncbi:methyltransferase domain-containing protein [Nocardia puris]|uniref:Methyltransferase family protein n=1 Tax=Nocardia puris TaxID=208602 RepID=A0A366CUT7_9NOCA|nr:SAM-dependent methyltransferase [Nocardia puris]RBO80085.1 hypothetical protein DFR74_1282 [Nocardia puris]